MEIFNVDYSHSLLGLVNSVIAKFGIVPHHDILDRELLGEKFEHSKRVVILLVDAMGYDVAKAVFEKEKELNVFGDPIRLSTIFPSTTVAALSTMATGALPIEHGMLGYVLYLKEYAVLANMIEFTPLGMPRDSLLTKGANPMNFLEVPTLYDEMRNYGAPPLVITANVFKESALSKMLNQGASVQGYTAKTDMMTKIRKAVESEKYAYIYAYWPMADAMGHVYGPNSEEYFEEVKDTLFRFKALVFDKLGKRLKDETSFLITADHGQMEASWKRDMVIRAEDDFVKTLEMLPCGEPRMLYLYTKDIEKTVKKGEEFFKGNVQFLETKKALSKGLFGKAKPAEKSLERIGDLLAIPTGDHSFTVKYVGNERHLKGKHGGLSKMEMEIPLFSF